MGHCFVEADVLEDLDPRDENGDAGKVLEGLVPERQVGEVSIEMRLCQQALQHHGHDEVPVDAEPDGRHRDLSTDSCMALLLLLSVKVLLQILIAVQLFLSR